MKTKTKVNLILLLALSASMNLHAESTIIAKIGNEEIQSETIRPYLENLDSRERSTLEKNPALLNQAVRTLILQQTLLKEAQVAGWEKQPAVAEQLERVRQAAIAESYLAAVTKVPEGYPSDADIQAAYELKKESLQIPRQYKIAQIYIPVQKGAADKAQVRVDAVAKSLKQTGADFAAIARAESAEAESAARGGEIGWVAESSLQGDIRKKITALSKGAVSEPIKFEDGWYIVKVLDINEAHTATLSEVKPQLTQFLKTERVKQNRDAYFSKLQQQSPVALNELALSKLLDSTRK
ncbi:MAG: peptidyl-prolyl cis-trans isomerase [Chthoniobacterales bacterium]